MILSDASPAVICSTLDLVSPPNERAVGRARVARRPPPARRLVRRQRPGPAGGAWWIPAGAVWSDVDVDGLTETPRSIGLGSGDSRDVAVLAGLSDRLGWEAEIARRHGVRLPGVPRARAQGAGRHRRLRRAPRPRRPDGRRRPATGSVLGRRSDRGRRLPPGAVRRPGPARRRRELEHLAAMLAEAGLEVATVDLATPTISDRGVHRVLGAAAARQLTTRDARGTATRVN